MAVDRHHGKEGRISCSSNHAEGATKGVATENNVAEGIGRRQFVEERKNLLLEGVGKVTVSERWIHEDCMSRVEDTRFCLVQGGKFTNATQSKPSLDYIECLQKGERSNSLKNTSNK